MRFRIPLIWVGAAIWAALSFGSASAQNLKPSLSANPIERSPGLIDNSVTQSSGGANDSRGSGNTDQSNSGNVNNNGDPNKDSNASRSGNPEAANDDGLNDDQRNNRDLPASRAARLLHSISGTITTLMAQWEYGPNELVPDFMATDQEVNDALQKVLNRPERHPSNH